MVGTLRAGLLGTDLLLASRLRQALRGEGLGLVEATGGDLLPPLPVVFVDLNHEPESRVEAITQLRSRNPSATIVGFCDHGETNLMRRAKEAGADRVIANRNLAEAAVRLVRASMPGGPLDER